VNYISINKGLLTIGNDNIQFSLSPITALQFYKTQQIFNKVNMIYS